MKLKIVSDGTQAGTKVLTEDGAEIDGVISVGFNFSRECGDGTLNLSPPRTTVVVENVSFNPNGADVL